MSPAQAPSPFCGLEHFTCCLACFDSRKGQREGHEDEKVLAFFPTHSVPLTTRTIIVGLAQALYGFTSTFTQASDSDGDPFLLMEAQGNVWVLYQCEPHIWLLMVVSKAWLGGSVVHTGLKAHLHSLYLMTRLLHGPIQLLLNQSEDVSKVLQPVLDEAGRLLSQQGPRIRLSSAPTPLTREASTLVNPLGLHRGLPLLVTPETPYLGAQCLAGRLQNIILHPPDTLTSPRVPDPTVEPQPSTVCSAQGQRPVVGVHVAWHSMPVWSTLGCEDAAAMNHLTQRALVPAAGIGRKKASPLKAVLAAAAAAAASSSSYMLPPTSAAAQPQPPATPSAASTTADWTSSTLLSPSQWAPVPATLPPVPAAHSQPQTAAAMAQAATSLVATQPTVGSVGRGAPVTRVVTQTNSTAAAATGTPGAATGTTAAAAGFSAILAGAWLFPAAAAADCGQDSGVGTQPGADSGSHTAPSGRHVARVWLQGLNHHVGLLPYHYGPLMVVLLLQEGVSASEDLLLAAEQVLSSLAPTVASQLHNSLPTSSLLWHQKGYRYSHEDAAADASRATPIKKVTTLSDGALRLASHTLNKLDVWTRTTGAPEDWGPAMTEVASSSTLPVAAGCSGGQDDHRGQSQAAAGSPVAAEGPGEGAQGSDLGSALAAGDYEVVVRTAADAWLDVRKAEGRRMQVVLDQAPVPSLLGVSGHVQRLCDNLYPGYFVGFS